jgi:sec-independent protein translocase protein TatA
MFGLGATELLLILAVVLVLFGASKIPQLGKGLGEGIRNFKQGLRGDERPEDDANRRLTPGGANEPDARR